jgi:hypothetical protein
VTPNALRVSRAQGLPTDQDDDHAKYLSQKARVFGVGCNTVLGQVASANMTVCLYAAHAGLGEWCIANCDAFFAFALVSAI